MESRGGLQSHLSAVHRPSGVRRFGRLSAHQRHSHRSRADCPSQRELGSGGGSGLSRADRAGGAWGREPAAAGHSAASRGFG